VFGEVAGNKLALFAGPLFNVFPEAIPQDDLGKAAGFRTPTEEDIKNAKDMASAAGISASSPVTIKLTTPDLAATLQFKLAAEHLKEQASKYLPGLNIEIELTDYTSMLAKVANPESGYHIYFGNWVHEPTSIGTLALVYRSTGGRNFTGFSDPSQDSLIQSAYGELDASKRTSTMKEIQQKAMQNWSHIPISQGRAATALQPYVEGYEKTSTVGQLAIRGSWLSKS
jgi:ABC-type transport system substrate-binding protein